MGFGFRAPRLWGFREVLGFRDSEIPIPLKKKEYTLDYNNRIPTDYDFTL